jgi:hypothetical protein
MVEWWPVTFALLVAAIIVIQRKGLPQDQQLRSLPSVLLLFPVLVLLWGGAAHVEAGIMPASAWRLAVLAVFILLQIVATSAVIYVSRDFRWQTAAIGLLIAWLTFVSAFECVLAFTGQLSLPERLL